MLLYPLRRGPVPAPDLPNPDSDGLSFTFSILRTVRDDPAPISSAVEHNQELGARTIAANGTVYPVSALPCLPGTDRTGWE